MNALTVIYDYRESLRGRTRSKKDTTVELGPWLNLETNKRRLYNTRIFYIIKPNIDDTIKFGIGGLDGKSGAWGRLHQYILEYGNTTELNPCTGVRLLYLAATVYNPNVETRNPLFTVKNLLAKNTSVIQQ